MTRPKATSLHGADRAQPGICSVEHGRSDRVRFVVVLANEDNPTGSEDSSSEGRQSDGVPRGTRGEGRGGRRVETTTQVRSVHLFLCVLLLLA